MFRLLFGQQHPFWMLISQASLSTGSIGKTLQLGAFHVEMNKGCFATVDLTHMQVIIMLFSI